MSARADGWWRELPAERRDQIFCWVTGTRRAGAPAHPEVPGQIPLIDQPEETDSEVQD